MLSGTAERPLLCEWPLETGAEQPMQGLQNHRPHSVRKCASPLRVADRARLLQLPCGSTRSVLCAPFRQAIHAAGPARCGQGHLQGRDHRRRLRAFLRPPRSNIALLGAQTCVCACGADHTVRAALKTPISRDMSAHKSVVSFASSMDTPLSGLRCR